MLDVGCATGLSFAPLAGRVGPAGRVVGIEQSPEMAALARRRIEQKRWPNVSLVCAPAEEARCDTRAHGALLLFTHDILRRPAAIDRVLAQFRPGARLVAAGLKWAPAWAWPTNLFIWSAAMHSVTSLEGLGAPWSHLELRVAALTVDTMLLGSVYIVRAELPG